MFETIMSLSLRRMFAGAAAFGTAVLALPAVAQQETTEPMTRVEITGSSIKRLAAQSSLPITAIRAEDFVKQGLSTVQEVLNTIPMNQTQISSSQSVGAGTGGQAVADLRGLGGNKTLVLLNGRRLASHPFTGETVDLNIIPVAALDRVEVLRDGASAIYGTDAIGGVVNFITKRSLTGFGATVEGFVPQHHGGADEQRINFYGGIGDLNTDGWNLFGIIDVHNQSALQANERAFASTGIRPEFGVEQTSGTPFPANFFSDLGLTGNPGFATGCMPPASIPRASDGTCRYDFSREVDLIPQTRQETFLGRFSRRFGEHTANIEYLHGRSTNRSAVAPPPMAPPNMTPVIHASSPFYPGGSAGVPAVPGLIGEDLTVSWRPLETGRRRNLDTSTSDRLVAAMEGSFSGWDYNGALSYSVARATSAFTGGYLIDERIVTGLDQGILNPFGTQTPAGLDFLNSSLLLGEYLSARTRSSAIDFRATRDLMELPAGPLGFAVGAEHRRDHAKYLVNRALASQASSSGYQDALDQFGKRHISAVFAEANVPVIRDLEINLAVRYDRYSDFGGTTNPKVALRYQPVPQVLVRASYNRGFRAPTLFDINAPQTTTNTSDTYNDPVLCPGGVPVAGANPNVACDQQQNIRSGGNLNLNPEKSRTYSAGIVFEPLRDLTISLDYWNIRLREQINTLAEQTLFGDYAKYQNLFVYNAARTELLYVLANTTNLGEVKTRGADVSVNYRLPRNPYGSTSVVLEGTYVNKYDYQNERGGPFTVNVGRYADATPVFRWRHNLLLSWAMGPWSVHLGNRFMSGYTDQNAVDPAFFRKVSSYSTWSLAGTFSQNKAVDYTLGVKNLTDKEPPYTNQGTTFQQGYDPRYTDPVGRTFYARVTTRF